MLHCTSDMERSALDYLSVHSLPKRMTLILYIVDKDHPYYDAFPVNLLRNLAIRSCRTTHFLVLDMDLRMTSEAVGGNSV